MLEIACDPRRIEVWVSMADHFLDTETRQDIPLTAMHCIAADLSIAEARDVWRYEVSPAVGLNLWSVAGEWIGWDRDWLIGRIDLLRKRWSNRPGTLRWLRYRIRVHLNHAVWRSIERCMEALLQIESRALRERMSGDLASLARHYFDFCPDDYSILEGGARARLRSLYPEPFLHVVAPATLPGELWIAARRVRIALESGADS